MKDKKYLIFVLILSFLASSLHPVFAEEKAESKETPVPTEEKKKSSWAKDAWDNFKSPVTTDAKYPLIIGAGVTVGLLLMEDMVIDPPQNIVVKHKPLGAFSKVGDISGQGYINAAYTIGMLGYGLIDPESDGKRNAAGMFQSSLYSILVTGALKFAIRQPRPDRTNRESFPSGHTTAAFSFASYIGCRHSLGWGLAAYSLATYVGFSRMNDNRHYLHDVTAGAAIGTAFGLGVCLAENERRPQPESTQSLKWYAAPTDGGAMAGVTIRY